MRVVRDGFGDVFTADGVLLHPHTRFLVDDKKRVAVFGNGKAAPTAVYAGEDVTFQVTRKPCACKGDPPKMTLMRLWDASERQAVG